MALFFHQIKDAPLYYDLPRDDISLRPASLKVLYPRLGQKAF